MYNNCKIVILEIEALQQNWKKIFKISENIRLKKLKIIFIKNISDERLHNFLFEIT